MTTRQLHTLVARPRLPEIIADSRLQALIPAAFRDGFASDLSSKYRPIPTAEIIQMVKSHDWQPVQAWQSRRSNSLYGVHLIRFQSGAFIHNAQIARVGDFIPEIVMTNSGNGKSRWIMRGGIFVLKCTNGVVAPANIFGDFGLKHIGARAGDYKDMVSSMLNNMPKLTDRVEKFRYFEVSHPDALRLAHLAAIARWKSEVDSPYSIDEILYDRRNRATRFGYKPMNAWELLNVIQENVIAGGLAIYKPGTYERERKVVSVNGIGNNMRINELLFGAVNYLVDNGSFDGYETADEETEEEYLD